MAPRKFASFVVAVSGTVPGYKQADIKGLVENQGATFTSTVTDECTHLITTLKEVEKRTTKYLAASQLPKCKIVSIDWLLASSQKKNAIAEKPYLLDADATADAGVADNESKQSSKRATRKAPAKSVDKDLVAGDGNLKKDADDEDDETAKKAIKSEEPAKSAKKRKIKEEDDDVQGITSSKRQKVAPGAAPKAPPKALVVPVDSKFLLQESKFKNPQIYTDSSGVIWDATLNQTNAGANNNKFYAMQLIHSPETDQFITWTRWGRVGESGQSASSGIGTFAQAQAFFEKKFKDKSGLAWTNRLDTPKNNKYTYLERNYEEDEEEDSKDQSKEGTKQEATETKPQVPSKLEQPLQDLMAFIFNQQHMNSALASMSYDAQKLPLGKLSERTLKAGFSVLKDLAELLGDPTLATSKHGLDLGRAQEFLSNRYFTLIPHVFGRSRPPILNTDAMIKKEVDLLEALTDMDVSNEILKASKDAAQVHPLDRQFESLGMKEMTQLDHKSTEFIELSDYLNHSRGATHSLRYEVIDIFRIERQGETDRFTNSPYSNLERSNRRLLWHGSRSTNFGGILSQGLRIAPPEAPVNGYMFGKGVYLADMSSKSANYCCSYYSDNKGLLLLCDTELGDPMFELVHGNSSAGSHCKSAGSIATLGKGGHIPAAWKDAGVVNADLEGVKIPDVSCGTAERDGAQAYLQYNEYIVYDVAQIRQRYLFYVNMK
ncbi:Uncharacterized protein PECH_001992 [Penicillium ucsense]|uniref:Poly [ADP-ribose] polymerase n=1 Tax=Penicillium ucsense TaxID=2839758 RepID=A0A8J8W074_9EURO|nr:Uncharacterized protein PECM_001998 [Penicillium ucsense]KAF7731348.1 Uncharacterized protein PECH_001992 [Penicillium ucsense]